MAPPVRQRLDEQERGQHYEHAPLQKRSPGDPPVIEEAGARIFVEPEAALILEDKILDATVVGDRVQFSLSEQD